MVNSPRADGKIVFVGKRHIFAGNTLCISRKCNEFPAENSCQMPKVHLISVYYGGDKMKIVVVRSPKAVSGLLKVLFKIK